jgi:hypothetical protein
MAIGFFEVAVPRSSETRPEFGTAKTRKTNAAASRRAARKFAEKYINRFDRNGDRAIQPDELPETVKLFGFETLDENADRELTLDEIRNRYEDCNQE